MELENTNFVCIPQPKVTILISRFNRFLTKSKSIGSPFLYFIAYAFWQKKAYKKAKQLHQKNPFDIAHQLTAITFREPGYLWKLGIPFVWGPTGGIEKLPFTFYSFLSFKSKIFEILRMLSTSFQYHFSLKVNKALTHASMIYLFSSADALRFEKRTKATIKLMTDAGTYKIESNSPCKTITPVKLLWVGRLEERKAILIFLEAINKLDHLKSLFEVTIIGTGSQKNILRSTLNKIDRFKISWIEKVSHSEIFEIMKNADLFVHTSYREATTNVIPEVLSLGLPVVCHKISGMDIAINESCGIKIPLKSPGLSISGFKNAIESLILDTNKLDKLKQGAKRRAAEISWDNMVKVIAYDYVVIYNSRKHL